MKKLKNTFKLNTLISLSAAAFTMPLFATTSNSNCRNGSGQDSGG